MPRSHHYYTDFEVTGTVARPHKVHGRFDVEYACFTCPHCDTPVETPAQHAKRTKSIDCRRHLSVCTGIGALNDPRMRRPPPRAPSPGGVSLPSESDGEDAPPPPRALHVPSPVPSSSSDEDEQPLTHVVGPSREVRDLQARCSALESQVESLLQRLDALRGETYSARNEHDVLLVDLCNFFSLERRTSAREVVAGIREQIDVAFNRLQNAENEADRLRKRSLKGDGRVVAAIQELCRFKSTRRHLLFCVHDDKTVGAPIRVQDAARVLRDLVVSA